MWQPEQGFYGRLVTKWDSRKASVPVNGLLLVNLSQQDDGDVCILGNF